jgi:hypothetical protein
MEKCIKIFAYGIVTFKVITNFVIVSEWRKLIYTNFKYFSATKIGNKFHENPSSDSVSVEAE